MPPIAEQGAALGRLIAQHGPLTGAELLSALRPARTATESDPGEALRCWRAATLAPDLIVRQVGTRYLRLDRKVEGLARLSPSILREFLTYSVVGSAGQPEALERRAADLLDHVQAVSRAKFDLAAGLVAGVAERILGREAAGEGYCVFIAGDVVYGMAHDVPRPERSTGRMVRGSDLDLVVLVGDDFPPAIARSLDEEIYRQKYRHLINPGVREEIDYIVKPLQRLRDQMMFDTFEAMVACKILQEGVLLQGSRELFAGAKGLLDECGVAPRLAAMETSAARLRRDAERHLLREGAEVAGPGDLHLFFTTDESEEFE